MKKWCGLIFLILFLFNCLSPITFAKDTIEVKDGEIIFFTESQKAATNIKYRTTGFMIHREPRCEPGKAQCDPRSKGPVGIIDRLEQVDEKDLGNGVLRTKFKVPEEVASKALGEAGLEEIREGDTIYISSIFDVLHWGIPTGVRYYDLQGIKKAETWANDREFGQFYDIQVKYSSFFPSYSIIKLSNGSEINRKKIENQSLPIHLNWPVGSTISHTFEKEIDHNGKKYKIYKSYIQGARKPNEQRFQQDGDPDTNPRLTQRNYTVSLGGTNVVAVYKEFGGPPQDPNPDPDPKPDPNGRCTAPTRGTPIEAKTMVPKVSAKILADNRGNERFDVSRGIPTSEALYANAVALNYLFQNKFVPMSGICTYEVPVTKTFTKTWTESTKGPDGKTNSEEMEEEETVSETITVKRPYSYWVIDNLEVYKIRQAELRNEALPNSSVILEPTGYTPPDFEVARNGGVAGEPHPRSITLPPQTVGKNLPTYSGAFKSAAEQAIGKVKVRNDSLIFKGNTVMNGDVTDERGPTPGSIPLPFLINENVLYKDRQLIESHKANAKDVSSTGTIYYDLLPNNINGGSDRQFPINGMNTITIHTPVLLYAMASDDREHNQKTKPNLNRSSFILDRPFTVYMPTTGKHRDIPGYGERDFQKYFRSKEVKFPFDAYSADRSQFFPKSTWISISVSQERADFFLPVWVDEGDYTIEFRSTAENAPSDATAQRNANLDLAHHRAADMIPIEVIGRLYDFKITDISDFNWGATSSAISVAFKRKAGV
ncbi:DUF5704 domain-containing protein [Paenibacillus sp. OSY-SE]|uniref:DUF5704 domain-containing protein n=1 Tax=Paenibacillus sp. OSY-SE TaxID=1196323 RepID=UPI00031E2216|nr:DUF5704 domain-containing protein [Paenibacillus sp. OSY-SE]